MEVVLLPKQMEFLTDTHKECALVSGIGFGKTTSGSLFVINETANSPRVPGLIVANTYTQLTSATLNNLKMWCEQLGIYYKYNSSTKMVKINQTEHFVRSAESFENTRGLEAGFLWVDEAAFVSQEATDVFLGRVRHNKGSLKVRYTTSPNGFNSFYHRMHKNGENYDPSRNMIIAKTSDNTFLPPEYIESLRLSYSAKMAAQELDAEFLSMAGLNVYIDFDRKKHLKECKSIYKKDGSQQLYVVVDYNVCPFVGVVCLVENGTLFVIDEIYLEGGSDTRMMAQEIKKRYGTDPLVIGDGTGNTKRNIINVKLTSYKIFQEEGLKTVEFSNPHVVKRIANVNRCLYHNLLIIEPSCRYLVRDLESVVYSKNSNDIDKNTNKDLSHISDALGYALWKLMPANNIQKQRTILF